MKARLTNTLLKSLEPKSKYYRVWDSTQPGLFVRVSPKGRKVFALRFISQEGNDRAFTIGQSGQVTLDQARGLARKHLGEIAQGVDVQVKARNIKRIAQDKKANTLQAFIETYYQEYLETHKKTGSVLLGELKTHFSEFYSRQLQDLDVRTLTNWRNQRLKNGIAPASVNRNISTLKAALNRAVEWGIIETNPLAKFKPLKLDKHGKVRYLSQDEENNLRSALFSRDQEISKKRENANQWRSQRRYQTLPAISEKEYSDHLTPVVLLALNTGMRRGELLQLSWNNVDLDLKFITIEGDTAKTGQTRHIPLNKEALNALNVWKKQRNGSELVFPSPSGEGSLNSIKKSWASVLEKAEISNFRFHDLRHHFASKLVMKGVDLNTVRELLGHTSIEMTLRYAHLAPQHKAAAVALLEN